MFDSFGVVITFFGCVLCYQETAHEKSQKYKEGKSVLERFKISGPDGSNYWVSSHGRHIGGSDADDS
ncbi:hypothetical protein F2Q68_00028180 [Brassica cretica]|uniref:Yippee domain-containing protein n=1 Tax=Brassica cretica TaxID=69181 RepID=A0A8S9IGM2_BRACR|nr:hypothetical protein F2Q68_00028180 [Brassica cretica]